MYLLFTFGNDKQVAIDPQEFGADAMGAVLDKLAIKHQDVKDVQLRPFNHQDVKDVQLRPFNHQDVPAQGVQTEHGLSHGDHPSGISLPSL